MAVDSDEELKTELERAVKKCKKNKPQYEMLASMKVPENEYKPDMTQRGVPVYVTVKNDPPKTQTNLNKKGISNEDALVDVMELINYFFLPKKKQNYGNNTKSYSDYERQGAIPKSRVKNYSKENNRAIVTDLIARLRSSHSDDKMTLSDSTPIIQTLNPLRDNEIVKVSEETCLKPFFYIVPENPSPNFSLPRGSYYIIPKVPGPSTEESIVFHPERGEHTQSGIRCRESSEIQSKRVETNNLGKCELEKFDSHLNIGPEDVKLGESINNLEINCTASKIYGKNFVSGGDAQDGFISPEEISFHVEVSGGSEHNEEENVLINNRQNTEKLDDLVQSLMTEFPNRNLTWSLFVAKKYLHDEPGLKLFIASERLECKIQHQFNKLVLSLPESDRFELLQKCKEFNGDEGLVDGYIENVRHTNRIHQRVTDLQLIFPDADPEFLFEEVRKFGDDDDQLNRFTEELITGKDYPKIPDDLLDTQRKELWKTYIVNYSNVNYFRNESRPERFAGPDGNNNKADINVILKYLRSRYFSANVDFIQIFRDNNKNLTKTCDHLNLSQSFAPLGDWLLNEPFDEEFLKEICYIEHKKEIDEFLKYMKELKEIEREDARVNDCFLCCPLCCDDELVASEVVPCPEGHVFCIDCIKSYVSVKIGEGVYKFICPAENCESFFTSNVLKDILPEKTVFYISKKQQAEEVSSAGVEGLETCPHCEFAYIPNPGDKIFRCQNLGCLIETCRICREKNHIPLRCEEVERSADTEARKKIEEKMTEKLLRVCPSCNKKIVKIDGCNKMSCPCGALFCYLCRTRITGYDHFNNKTCPLYSNNEELHNVDVINAGIQTRDEILRENPNIRILYDPTS